jgi:DNA-3-methyladenine glycosylase I
MSTYCEFTKHLDAINPHRIYHDHQYGFPILNDDELFGRLLLEINQAGLSWTTILNKADNFRAAYAGFSIEKVAQFDEHDKARLMADSGIIRNRLKIEAAIYNAKKLLEIQQEFGSFVAWLDAHLGKSKVEWTKLFKKTFKFTGGLIVEEFLMSTGYIKGAHIENCPIFDVVKRQQPKWLNYEN